MAKVSIKYTTDFTATSDSIVPEAQRVRETLNQMFDALDRYQAEKGIVLKDIKIDTYYDYPDIWIKEAGDDEEEPALTVYRITATSVKEE